MGRLILLRHGESVADAEDAFAGWLDVALTEAGVAEAQRAGRELAAAGVRPDVVHTSLLGRAINTAYLLIDAHGTRIPLQRHWRLNARHHGALQGLSRREASARYGAERVSRWRRSVDARPPALSGWPLADQLADTRYREPAARAVWAESLAQTRARIEPYWRGVLAPELAAGRTVLVVSHGNALRMLTTLVRGVPAAEGVGMELPIATPVILAESGQPCSSAAI